MLTLLWLGTAACGEDLVRGSVAPGERLADLSDPERARFLLGRALFERLATPEEGLGPLFNAERCSSCHDEGGIGGGGFAVPVLKATRYAEGTCSPLIERGGDNIQRRATPQLVALGLGPEEVPSEATATRLVTAPPLFGLGLLEAVPVAELERRADPSDADGNGIRGRVPRDASGIVRRFGRKGDAATVREFVESALRFELGFTVPSHPVEETRNGVALPKAVDPMPDPEMDQETIDLIVDFVRYLAPPAPSGAASEPNALQEGERIFERIGCAECHVPELVTGPAQEQALSRKRIRPFTDLLLHDVGGAEGDVCTPVAGPGEVRTPALWGLRHRRALWHDGSAPTPEVAILRHGGEAARVTAGFEALGSAERSALLEFLATL